MSVACFPNVEVRLSVNGRRRLADCVVQLTIVFCFESYLCYACIQFDLDSLTSVGFYQMLDSFRRLGGGLESIAFAV